MSLKYEPSSEPLYIPATSAVDGTKETGTTGDVKVPGVASEHDAVTCVGALGFTGFLDRP